MESNLQRFYEGQPITFNIGNNGTMVNATEMAKPFGKLVADWLRLKSTNQVLNEFSVMGIPITELIIVNQGGDNQGTWLHEDLAMIFAQWLSPRFYIWCNTQVKEMLKRGVSVVSPRQLREIATDKHELQALSGQKNLINKRLRFLRLRIEENETAIYSAFQENRRALVPEIRMQYSLF